MSGLRAERVPGNSRCLRRSTAPWAGTAYSSYDCSKAEAEHAECVGTATNNKTEYRALIAGLGECVRFTAVRERCGSDI